MNPKEIRREKIHQRIHILRIRYDRCIIFSLILLSVGLAVCMGIMFQEMHLSGVPAVVDSYGSVLLRDGADLYVIIGNRPAVTSAHDRHGWGGFICDYRRCCFCSRCDFYDGMYLVSE